MIFKQIVNAIQTNTPDIFKIIILVNFEEGNPDEEIPFILAPNDSFGFAPQVRESFEQWLQQGNTPQSFTPDPVSSPQVNSERDRRIRDNFVFDNIAFDFDPNSKANISGAAQLAFMSIVSGAQAGDLRWHGGDYDFVWLAKDNTPIPMDAQTVVNFGKAAANHESMHVFAARVLKNMDPIPQDYTDDVYWP